jgi:hypothetical protein
MYLTRWICPSLGRNAAFPLNIDRRQASRTNLRGATDNY